MEDLVAKEMSLKTKTGWIDRRKFNYKLRFLKSLEIRLLQIVNFLRKTT